MTQVRDNKNNINYKSKSKSRSRSSSINKNNKNNKIKHRHHQKIFFLKMQNKYEYGPVDFTFLMTLFALLVIGIVMMFSSSYAWAISENRPGFYYAKQQMYYCGIGLAVMFILSIVDYRRYKTKIVAMFAYFIPLVLLVYVLLFGTEDNGAQRWISLGSIQFQPSELMKIGIVISFAYFIEKGGKKIRKLKTLLCYLAAMGVVGILMMLQPHLSGTIIIFSICVILLVVGGANLWQILGMGIVGIAGLVGFVLYIGSTRGYTYFMTRVEVWLHPFRDMSGDGWQTCQSLIAIGSGGFFGLGLGRSKQKYLYLPESKNDFVFSIVCEELGFVGAMTVIILFAILVIRGYRIAAKAPDKFGMLMAIGFTSHIGIQAFLNIAVVSNLITNTGISLPFFSYGGTALILQLAEMGVVLNISKQRYKITPKQRRTAPIEDENNAPEPIPRLEA